VQLDEDRCYRVVHSKDARFDGWFVTAVTSTGIYCRPSCPAVTPKRANVRFYATAAAAQGAGFRACKRCRPDATPGSPEWNLRADVVARAMRLVADGVVDREGVGGLAARLGYSERHLTRVMTAELGAGPLAVARAQRAQTARLLVETTGLPFAQIAFAAGFDSIRQFNDTVREVFASTPTDLRAAAARRPGTAAAAVGTIAIRLPYRAPCDVGATLEFLGARAVPGVELYDGATYRRSLALPRGGGTVALTPAAGHVACVLRLDDLRDLAAAVQRCRRLLDLDADPVAVDEHLGADDVIGPLVRNAPGRRSPGAVDGHELVVRAILGQQVSVAAARTHAGRLVQALGEPLRTREPGLTHTFPTAGALATAPDGLLAMPARRRATLRTAAAALANGTVVVDPGAERAATEAALLALPGVGPWTAAYVAMRALGDPDVFLPTDLGVRHALAALGHDGRPGATARLGEHWRPWRSYALHHLWASLS
jgi:AraC family transcriptional regulator, regulatory protein of adaptative response / DNA-3-methyladenine glycosylase II